MFSWELFRFRNERTDHSVHSAPDSRMNRMCILLFLNRNKNRRFIFLQTDQEKPNERTKERMSERLTSKRKRKELRELVAFCKQQSVLRFAVEFHPSSSGYSRDQREARGTTGPLSRSFSPLRARHLGTIQVE